MHKNNRIRNDTFEGLKKIVESYLNRNCHNSFTFSIVVYIILMLDNGRGVGVVHV